MPVTHPLEDAVIADAVRTIRGRLLPLLFVLYVVAFLDRINVGFAALQMQRDLHLGPAAFGLGAGVFFIGYALFEVPSNVVLARLGARRWIGRILLTWGVVACSMVFVRGLRSFVTVRFMLGLAEAGFFPGILYYLGGWFPMAERARAMALFLAGVPLATVVGGPVSAMCLALDGIAGVAGWQWLFVLEGLPAIVLGGFVLRRLPDGPQDAAWLSERERRALMHVLADESASVMAHRPSKWFAALRQWRVWHLTAVYFALTAGLYGLTFWLPQLIRLWGSLTDVGAAIVAAVPYLMASLVMVIVARSSDRRAVRHGYVAASYLAAALGFTASALTRSPVAALLALTIAACGIMSAIPPFWTIPGAFLRGEAAAAGIALINSVGNLGGFVAPYAVGTIRERTGSFTPGLLLLAAIVFIGAVVMVTPVSAGGALTASRRLDS